MSGKTKNYLFYFISFLFSECCSHFDYRLAVAAMVMTGAVVLSCLIFVLKHFDHILVAPNELAALVQHSSVRETAFLHDLS